MIVAVAIRLKDGRVLSLPRPARHCHFSAEYNAVSRALEWDVPWEGWPWKVRRGCVQGFLDETGVFYNRKAALKYALACGQIASSKLNQLFSEDLW